MIKKVVQSYIILTIIIGNLYIFSFVNAAPGDTTRVSVASDGTQGNGNIGIQSISGDGRYVAFSSDASNLVPGDTNEKSDIFLHDRQTGETIRVSVASDGTQGSWSGHPSISADGRYVAFTSSASNLVPGDINEMNDVFLHDQQTGQTSLVSMASDGTQGNNWSGYPSISANGRYVAFSSDASNLVPGDTNGARDTFVHDLQTGTTTRVSVTSNGSQGYPSGPLVIFLHGPTISADGRFIVFTSNFFNLVPGDTNEECDIFLHDRQTGQTSRVSVASDGTQADGWSSDPKISADGRYVAFSSGANNLVPGDTNEKSDIFLHDRQTGETIRVSVASDGTQGNNYSGSSSISANGRYVAFSSSASNLVPGDTNEKTDVFVHEVSWEEPESPSWLLMYYMAADNNLDDVLLSEVWSIIDSRQQNVDIAIFLDSTTQDSSYRFFKQGGPVEYLNKGNLNSGNGPTLTDFILWAESKSAAPLKALIIFDHGHGLSGVAWDERANQDYISVQEELRSALSASGAVDVLYSHTCLTANMEFIWELRGLTNYYVASESIAFNTKHDYIAKIGPNTTPLDLAESMAESYDSHRNRYNTPSTISVINMDYLDEMFLATNALALDIKEAPLNVKYDLWNLLDYTVLQRFHERGSIKIDNEDRLADLFHFASLVEQFPDLSPAAQTLLNLENDFVVDNRFWSGMYEEEDEKAVWDYSNARGVSIALPLNPISFYDGEWLEFAAGADWSFVNPGTQASIKVDGFNWGPMVSDLIAQNNPQGEDDPLPPDPLPLIVNYSIYLPILIR